MTWLRKEEHCIHHSVASGKKKKTGREAASIASEPRRFNTDVALVEIWAVWLLV